MIAFGRRGGEGARRPQRHPACQPRDGAGDLAREGDAICVPVPLVCEHGRSAVRQQACLVAGRRSKIYARN